MILEGQAPTGFVAGAGGNTLTLSVYLRPRNGKLIATATLFSLVSTSCMVTIKFFLRKAKKHEKIQTLAEATLSMINSLISTALEDGVISDGEYQDIVKKYNTFTTAKTKLRFSNHTDSGVKVNKTSKTTAV